MGKAKIYRFDYMTPGNILHHKYFSCLTSDTAILQFEARCDHKSIDVDSFQVYECQPGCYKWELVFSREVCSSDADDIFHKRPV